MKTKLILLSMLLTAFLSMPVMANDVTTKVATKTEWKYVKSNDPKVLENRLNEIREMSKKNLSSEEKKELRAETKEIRSALRELGGGVYISAGALIVILILLIILT